MHRLALPCALSLVLLSACRTKPGTDDGTLTDSGAAGGDTGDPTTDTDTDGDTDGDTGGEDTAPPDPDEDGDGYPASEDCDDGDAAVNPGATEVCNDVDDDCDDVIDEDDAADATTWYADGDDDGWGVAEDAGGETVTACDAPDGYVAAAGDCDDDDPAYNPGAAEDDCTDPNDYNCDGSVGYVDADEDGWAACEDCDDGDADVFPGAVEVCNDVDDDCDTEVDEDDAADAATWYADSDEDGFGDPDTATTACEAPDGYRADATDCDDGDADVFPGAVEVCNDIDDDCDTEIDEDDAADAATWYADADEDGFGDPDTATTACEAPDGWLDDASDCDDGDADVNPDATEVCNGGDDDCDDDVDEGLDGSGEACAADSCLAIVDAGTDDGDGTYWLQGESGDVFEAFCDMTRDGGGWTLIGSVVNEYNVSGSHDRNWDSVDVWTDTTTMGALEDRQTNDYKGPAFYDVAGDDYMMVTDEYAFAFYELLGAQDFATFFGTEYDTSTCSEDFLASGTDWSESLSADQDAMMSFIVRPKDTNAACFPDGNENAVLGHHITWYWANGAGNTPDGYPSWQVYDLSMLQLSYLSGGTCTAGSYPCNDLGYHMDGTNGYTVTTKVTWGELYVR